MALILLIETSAKNCSVALANDESVIALREQSEEQYIHAEKLHLFVQQVMADASKTLSQLDAIAVSKGPGSYTGLRIGVSAAKGFAFALNLPLIAVGTLEALAHHASVHFPSFAQIRPMIDARRDEVYTALFSASVQALAAVSAEIINAQFFETHPHENTCYIGDGVHKALSFIADQNAVKSIIPSASMMAALAHERYLQGQLEDVAYFEPYYLKEFIAGAAKKVV